MTDNGLALDVERDFERSLVLIVSSAKQAAGRSVNLMHVVSCWLVGRQVVEQEQKGRGRADYGKRVVEIASQTLTDKFGAGYSVTNIKNFRSFFLMFKDVAISQALPDQFRRQIGQALSDQSSYAFPANLSWSHYERLIRVHDETERMWYMQEAAREQWDYRTLGRNISSQYYYRMIQTPSEWRGEVEREMHQLTAVYERHKLEYLKNPVVAEFLGLPQDKSFTESRLEDAIISHLQLFILELGKGYAFVARQKHIKTDMGDYYIDLVFYNYILKFFLLIDLKTEQITYKDVGQMDLYVRMYDELKCTEGDNPTIGLVLCADTSSDLARFSILKESKQIFAAKYLTYLPTEEELRREIEEQKAIFEMRKKSADMPNLEQNDAAENA